MKGRGASADEKKHMSRVRALGCIACANVGIETPEEYTLIHHIDGKTKPGAHYLVLPLCEPHHSRYNLEGFHNNPTQWQAKHGSQYALLSQVKEMLDGNHCY